MPISSLSEPGRWLRRQLADHAYPGYVYGYPHKKAYRPLATPLPLADAWADEGRDRLFCYVHLPFCSQRCSFCNLFTAVPAGGDPTRAYLDALARDMEAHARALPSARFRRLYLGGGTPTFLDTPSLDRLFRHLHDLLGIVPDETHGCIEASPETLDADKVALLRARGFRRVSLGVQSFVEGELRAVNRRFDFALHRRALDLLGAAGFPELNLDLIYGLPGQTSASWHTSLEAAIDSPATSLFLYPLYVRPLTGLARRPLADVAPTPPEMAVLYDRAVERLAGAGFRQLTMRQFRRDGGEEDSGEEYRCQSDGMVGLGAGARSYTARLHYSTPWRMAARNIRAVIDDYQHRLARGDTAIRHGFALDDDERQRRFVIQSLLHRGVEADAFARRFGSDLDTAFAPLWEALRAEDLVTADGPLRRLTPRGLRHADVVGQLFFSPRVRALIDTYEYDA